MPLRVNRYIRCNLMLDNADIACYTNSVVLNSSKGVVAVEKFYQVNEFVALLKERHNVSISERTVRKWIQEGRIQANRVGVRKWYIPESEVQKVLSGETSGHWMANHSAQLANMSG